jgi:putative heme-binding domain-containing protein
VAIEHQDPKTWQKKALEEKDPGAALPALLALVRTRGIDPFHRKKDPPEIDPMFRDEVLAALKRLDWAKLTDAQRLDLIRVYQVALNRLGPISEKARKDLAQRFQAVYPTANRDQNAELCALLVYLQAPQVAAKTLKLMAAAPTQEEQMEYARSLRVLKTGWTLPERQEYFKWYLKAHTFKGGNSLGGFLRRMKSDAVATLTAEEKKALKPILEAKPPVTAPIVGKPRPLVKKYTMAELVPLLEKGLKKKRNFDKGRRLFAEAKCFVCHRFDGEGGAQGPDLTGAAGRFNTRDIVESIIEPSKVISDQYAAVVITTSSGKIVTGRIVNLNQDSVFVNTDMLDPNALTIVNRKKIEKMEGSKVSMMPEGLLDTFKKQEIYDLVAFLLSRGDRNNKMFR